MMKKINKNTVIIALGTLLIGLLLGWLFFGTSDQEPSDEHNHSVAEASETTWTCSMHPQIRQSGPGDCPICGMDLILLETTDSELDPMAISMSSTAMQLAQVQTLIVDKGNAEKSIRLNGKVQTDERLLFTQSSHIPGRIEKLMVNFTGEFVSQGQVIAFLYSPELVTAQEELFEARKIKETQPALFNAAKEKLKNWKLTDKQVEQILSSEKAIEQFPVQANVSGYVTRKMVNLGDYIKQGQAIYEIADLSRVWVLFDVYESDMNWIKHGASVNYTVQSLPGKTFNGKIGYIDPVIDPKTRVAKARISTNNSDLALKPEMFVSGTLEAKVKTSNASITVPKTAVMWTGKRSVVYVMQNSAQGISFKMREVTLGPTLGESYVIEAGLEAGEEIAVNGTFSIDAAAQLAGKPSMMNPEGGVAMTGHNHSGTKNLAMENMPTTTRKTSLSTDAKKSLQPLLDHYFNLKTALVADDFEEAKEAGASLKTSLSQVNMNHFKGQAHNVWMELSASLKSALEHIEHKEDIESLRQSFITISNVMIALAESFEPNSSSIYVQHCPMADSNIGADWLSRDKEIRNPYFGKAMLTCGEVTKTLK